MICSISSLRKSTRTKKRTSRTSWAWASACGQWRKFSNARRGATQPTLSRDIRSRHSELSGPDFVCTFPDGTFGIFEAKGTTQSYGTSNSQAEGGKQQTAKIVPTNGQVSVRCCCAVSIQKEAANQRTRLLLLDPPQAENALPVALSRDKIIERTAMRRFREKPFGEIQTLFRGPQGITGTAREMTLTRKPYLQEKKHGWLDIETP